MNMAPCIAQQEHEGESIRYKKIPAYPRPSRSQVGEYAVMRREDHSAQSTVKRAQ